MNRFLTTFVVLCSIPIASAGYAQAPTAITDHIPSDVRGFVVLKNMQASIKKIETLATRFEAPLPPLDAMLGNLDAGLDKQGDLGVAWLDQRAGDDAQSAYMHFVAYVPVTDYKAFLAQFKPADPDGKIVAVSFNGQEIALAQKGPFAIVADVEEMPSLEHVLASSESIVETAKPLGTWLGENDVTVSLTPKGTALMFAKLKEGLAMIKAVAMQSAGENSQMIEAALGLYDSLFDMGQREVDQLAIGLRIDTDQSISLHKRVVFSSDGSLAGAAGDLEAPKAPFSHVPAGPFVVAVEGAIPQTWAKDWVGMSFNMLNSMRGAEDKPLSQENIAKLTELASKSMQDVQAMSFSMGVGDGDEGIYGRTIGTMRVKDAQAFLNNYAKSFSETVKLMEDTPWADAYEVEEVTVDGKSVVRLTMDMTKFQYAVPGTEEVVAEYYERMFGEDGKMKVYLASLDDTTVVMAYTSTENLQRALAVGKNGVLADDVQLKKTAAMLPAEAQWVGYISPGGIMQFASNMIGVFAPGVEWELGDFPASPPLGFSVELTPQHLDGQLLVPLETIDAAKTFAEQMQR